MKSVDLSIIIVNWNSKEYVRKCIASILASACSVEYEIIVVDSASFDGCGDMLQRLYPETSFIQSELNIGFARANNLGATSARGSLLLFLNPDTEIQGRAIELLCSRFRELPRAGVVGCRLLNSDGSLQTSCVQPFPTILNQVLDAAILHRWFPKRGLWMTAATFEGESSPVSVDAVSGACMLVTREVLNLVRGFSTDYFMYAEDIDLCYKTKSIGCINYYIPGAEIIHHGGGSTQHSRSSFSDVMIADSVGRLLRKTRGDAYGAAYRVGIGAVAVVRIGLLAFLFPAVFVKRTRHPWRTAFIKWIAILRWGLGLQGWVRRNDRQG